MCMCVPSICTCTCTQVCNVYMNVIDDDSMGMNEGGYLWRLSSRASSARLSGLITAVCLRIHLTPMKVLGGINV